MKYVQRGLRQHSEKSNSSGAMRTGSTLSSGPVADPDVVFSGRSAAPVSPSQAWQLQSMIGNRAVTAMLGKRSAVPAAQGMNISAAPANQPIQRYYDENGEWVDGPIPKGYVMLGLTKGGVPKFGLPKKETEAVKKEEAEPEVKYPKTTRQQEEEIHKHPKYLVRNDDYMHDSSYRDGKRKAFLNKTGLRSAGPKAVSTADQMNNASTDKPLSNAISTSNPEKSPNRTDYGEKVVKIKLHKLLRAQKRGKPDAQGIKVESTSDIIENLNKDGSLDNEDREKYKNYARKDGEYHIRVEGANSTGKKGSNPARVLRSRFIEYKDYPNEHDSDSDSEVEEAPDELYEDEQKESDVQEQELEDQTQDPGVHVEEKDTAAPAQQEEKKEAPKNKRRGKKNRGRKKTTKTPNNTKR